MVKRADKKELIMNELNDAQLNADDRVFPGAGTEDHDLDLPEALLADLPAKLQQSIAQVGWQQLMPVQSKAIPYLYSHHDTMIQSRTGSGKTGAYLIPILDQINPLNKSLQALVLVPTRELANQVTGEAKILGESLGVKCQAVYGGVGFREQLDALKSGVQLVVGTPGRVLDHLMRRSMVLDHLVFLVFDEADHMLSMGFYPDMKRVQSYLPDQHIYTYMFSATFPPQVLRLTSQFMVKPAFLNLSSDHVHVTEIEHLFYTVPGMDKDRSLVRIIEVENPLSALIFCNTKVRVEYVATVLQRFGYDCDYLTSDLSQAAREKVLERVRAGTLRFLIATDVAARGIDLPELSHVIQYEPPEDSESYIHRSGRTGRAGAGGTAITLVNAGEKSALMNIGKQFKINMQERSLPTDEDVQAVVSERVITLLEAKLRGRDRLQAERMQRFSGLIQNWLQNSEDNDSLLILLDDFYQDTFHAPLVPHEIAEYKSQNMSHAHKQGAASKSRPPRRRRR
jgi:ATP-dependent RNA helicase DeaD